jgi:hypothetical protein
MLAVTFLRSPNGPRKSKIEELSCRSEPSCRSVCTQTAPHAGSLGQLAPGVIGLIMDGDKPARVPDAVLQASVPVQKQL